MKKIVPFSAAILLVLSLALFALSLALAACQPMTNSAPGEIWSGYVLLFMGPLGLLTLNFSWLGNVFLLAGWINIFRGRRNKALVYSAMALVAAGSFSFYDAVPVGSSGSFPFKLLPGYYVWLASMTVALLAGVLLKSGVRPDASLATHQP